MEKNPKNRNLSLIMEGNEEKLQNGEIAKIIIKVGFEILLS